MVLWCLSREKVRHPTPRLRRPLKMSSSSSSIRTFRTVFALPKVNLNWFPKHMFSGMKQMQAKLRSVDCILEVHDARIPLSGRNPVLSRQLVGPIPHILVMNKSDLISNQDQNSIRKALESSVSKILFTNAKNDQDSGLKKLVPTMKNLVENSERYHRAHTREYHSMIIGIPNVGKSSIINALRSKYLKKGRALKVGPAAGVTKCVHMKVKISESPLIYLFDTPGILQPRVNDIESGMKLAACSNLPDAQVGFILIADYVLYNLNKCKNFKYVEFTSLEEPSDCIATVLLSVASRYNYSTEIRNVENQQHQIKPDVYTAAQHFVLAFRRGEFGKVVLDDLTVQNNYHSFGNQEQSQDYQDQSPFLQSDSTSEANDKDWVSPSLIVQEK